MGSPPRKFLLPLTLTAQLGPASRTGSGLLLWYAFALSCCCEGGSGGRRRARTSAFEKHPDRRSPLSGGPLRKQCQRSPKVPERLWQLSSGPIWQKKLRLFDVLFYYSSIVSVLCAIGVLP